MLSPQFYETFANFEYILIYQLDAFVFYDALEEFCALGYDYIGAPWPRFLWNRYRRTPKTPRVGNGGFSLRKVKACNKFLTEAFASPIGKSFLEFYAEDMFLATCAEFDEFDFKIAPIEVANLFSMEHHPDRHVKRFGLPFGCHYWHIFSADFYVELFARFGYDLRPLRRLMDCKDYELQAPIYLTDVAITHLLNSAERGHSISAYLPTKRFASIRVLRSPDAMKILSLLLTEENSLSDEIFIYDEVEWTNLLRDMTAERLPHLLIVDYYDVSPVKALEGVGLRYGRDFISFQREYIASWIKAISKFGRRTPQ